MLKKKNSEFKPELPHLKKKQLTLWDIFSMMVGLGK